MTRKSILLEEPSNRYCLNPSSIHFTNGYFAVCRLALANLPTCANYGAVVVLYELQKFCLLWVWVKGNQTILERHNLEVLLAEIQHVVLASLEFPGAFLELLWGQNLLLASLLD